MIIDYLPPRTEVFPFPGWNPDSDFKSRTKLLRVRRSTIASRLAEASLADRNRRDEFVSSVDIPDEQQTLLHSWVRLYHRQFAALRRARRGPNRLAWIGLAFLTWCSAQTIRTVTGTTHYSKFVGPDGAYLALTAGFLIAMVLWYRVERQQYVPVALYVTYGLVLSLVMWGLAVGTMGAKPVRMLAAAFAAGIWFGVGLFAWLLAWRQTSMRWIPSWLSRKRANSKSIIRILDAWQSLHSTSRLGRVRTKRKRAARTKLLRLHYDADVALPYYLAADHTPTDAELAISREYKKSVMQWADRVRAAGPAEKERFEEWCLAAIDRIAADDWQSIPSAGLGSEPRTLPFVAAGTAFLAVFALGVHARVSDLTTKHPGTGFWGTIQALDWTVLLLPLTTGVIVLINRNSPSRDWLSDLVRVVTKAK